MDNKKKIILSGLAVTLIAGATSGAALAYLTDGETAENTFIIGDVSIEGIEPNYPGNDSNEVKDIVPNKEIAKDPQIDNDGVNDAIVFMTVDSPMEYITVVADNGVVQTAKSVNELFWFKDAEDELSDHANNFDDGWQNLPAKEMYVKIAADGTETQLNASTPADLLAAYQAKDPTDTIVKRYVFGYKQAIQGSSEHDGTEQTAENKVTTPLFDKVQLKNVLENEIDEATEKIVVRSYAIQSSKILENDVDLATTLNETNLGKIYDIFIRQNSLNDDASGTKVEGLRDIDTLTPTSNGASGTTDAHKNRFGTDDDVATPNNVNPNGGQSGGGDEEPEGVFNLLNYVGDYELPDENLRIRIYDGGYGDAYFEITEFSEKSETLVNASWAYDETDFADNGDGLTLGGVRLTSVPAGTLKVAHILSEYDGSQSDYMYLFKDGETVGMLEESPVFDNSDLLIIVNPSTLLTDGMEVWVPGN